MQNMASSIGTGYQRPVLSFTQQGRKSVVGVF